MFISVKERGILSHNGLERSKSNAADLRNQFTPKSVCVGGTIRSEAKPKFQA